MALASGTRLGHYEILALIGAGGMGEVYRARDTKLGRDVAIKLLPPPFARDAERLARFQREAQVLAALNHPNIAAIYGLEESGDTQFLVLEYVAGETLRGPVPVEDALRVARQVAQALEAAHEKGIVHRDLKPDNIKLTPDGCVKVLDFGLAKAFSEEASDAAATLTSGATRAGTVLGTAAYMSPEQARGKPVDKRTDIWAFGCVLYELLAGRQAFGRETASDSTAAILEHEPDWKCLPAATPPHVRNLLRRCLQKDRALRLRDAGDASLELLEGSAPIVPAAAPARSRWISAAALLLGVALGASLLLWRRPERNYWKLPASGPKHVLRHAGLVYEAGLASDAKQFAYVYKNELYLQTIGGGEPRRLTNDSLEKSWPRFSPDGGRLIFDARRSEGKTAVYLLELPAGTPRLLVDDASKGVWSPDGSKLAFIRPGQREAFVADAQGQQPHSLGSVRSWSFGGPSWSRDSKAVCLVDQGKVFVASADGRSRKQVPVPEKVRAASFTPDGNYLLVGKPTSTQVSQYYQVPVRGGALIPFLVGPYHVFDPTFSQDGKSVLVVSVSHESNLVLFDAAQKESPGGFQQVTFSGDAMLSMGLSADEQRIAFIRLMGAGYRDIWIVNPDGTDPRQLTTRSYRPNDLAWSPDGRTLASSSQEKELWTVRLDEGNPRQFPTVAGQKTNPSYTADGNRLVFELIRNGKSDLWMAPAEGGEGTALTEDGVSSKPRTAPRGALVAFFRQTPAKTYELAVLDVLTRQARVVAMAQALAQFGKLGLRPPRWSRDAQFLFVSTEGGVLRSKTSGGGLQRFSFPINPWNDFEMDFEVLANQRILTFRETRRAEPLLYDDLQ
jgi:Tol biopolymer transport system component